MTDSADLKSAVAPVAVRAALAARADELLTAAHPHHPSAMADVREAEYRGHRIEVRTSYAITVDGRPFDIHVVVDNEGRVFYHGLPTRDFASVIGLVEKAIEQFPDDFRPGAGPGETGGGHQHGEGHSHGEGTSHHDHTHGEVH
jgi:hypothetical protein